MSDGKTELMSNGDDGTTYACYLGHPNDMALSSNTIKYNGTDKSMSCVKITSKTSNSLNFLFKSGRTFYRGLLPLTETSGTINVTSFFTVNIADAKVNGSTVSNISSYLTQGLVIAPPLHSLICLRSKGSASAMETDCGSTPIEERLRETSFGRSALF